MLTALVVVPFILSAVTAAQYGLWLVLVSAASLLYYSDFGVGTAIVHFASRVRGGGESRTPSDLLSAGILWNTLAAIVVVPLYVLMAGIYVAHHAPAADLSPGVSAALIGLGALTVAVLIIRPFNSALAGAGFLPIEQRFQGIATVVRLVGTLLVCWLAPSLVLIAVVETLALLLPSVLCCITIVRLRQHRVRWSRTTISTMRYMMRYSLRAFASSLIDAALLQGGTLATGILLAPADATYFSIAYRIFSSVRQLLYWITEPLRPALSRLYAVNKVEGDRVLQAMSRTMLAGATVGCLILILAGPGLIRLWVGGEVPVTSIAAASALLLAGLILNSIHIPFAAAAYAAGKPAAFLLTQLMWLCAFLALVKPLSANFGTVGVAAAFAMPLLIVEPLCLFIAKRTLDVSIRQWLWADVLPVAYLVLPGTAASATYFLFIHGEMTGLRSIGAAGVFIAGVAAAAIVRPAMMPTAGLRTIFQTEL
ncbi:membrane protein involved in the export of O-antigen and teichoic acid [Mycolicibacterium chubuense NBB4]|uniref:Membrane protein involved in the export of O-antigen and teichoic acid n=1 Tax=Mycolicibacterium chubuense (strain NBB4) TaxID=710421 RepID=I4BFP7_MYCCN|nr:membrane protein involved in the export of O-antigen and teichoic acid [Mycolicibacterium chubuense NBB4]